jgi:hypothetical protein
VKAPTSIAMEATSPDMDPHEINARKNQEWFAKRADLIPRVEAIFEKHCKLYRAPSRDDCRTVASALLSVRLTEDAEARRKDHQSSDHRSPQGLQGSLA